MKKVITLLSAVLICSSLSFGQDTLPHADISVQITKPAMDTTIAYGDSLLLSFVYTNNGPDELPSGDTLFFDAGGVLFWSVLLQPMAPGNTFIYSDVVFFTNPTDSTLETDVCVAVVPQSDIQYNNGGVPTTTYIDDDSSNDVDCHHVVLLGPDSNTNGISNLALSGINDLEVYPNPVANYLNFDLPEQSQNASLNIVVLDLTGRLVLERQATITRGKFSVDVSDLPAGVYMLKTQVGIKLWRAKFVKK